MQLVSDNPDQRSLAVQLEGMARDLQTINETLLDEARNGNASQVRSLISGGHADDTMAGARGLLADMQAEENRLLIQRRLAHDRARRDATLALWGTGGLSDRCHRTDSGRKGTAP